MNTQCKGFTLIEISIVLVVVSLILGSVLKGQELINNAKTRSIIKDFQSTAAAYHNYQERFKATPGDDANVAIHLGSTATTLTTTSLLGNGRINGNWNSASSADESFLFWQQVRLAGLLSGSPLTSSNSYAPLHAAGGPLGITGESTVTSGTPTLGGSFAVCAGNIDGRLAQQIDAHMDDGVGSTGSVQIMSSSSGSSGSAITTPAEGSLYTVCAAY